jgi:hypothetical protein
MMHNKKSADGIIKKGGTQASKMMAGGGMAKTKMVVWLRQRWLLATKMAAGGGMMSKMKAGGGVMSKMKAGGGVMAKTKMMKSGGRA